MLLGAPPVAPSWIWLGLLGIACTCEHCQYTQHHKPSFILPINKIRGQSVSLRAATGAIIAVVGALFSLSALDLRLISSRFCLNIIPSLLGMTLSLSTTTAESPL